MRTTFLPILAAFAQLSYAQTHGEGEEGDSMGPVVCDQRTATTALYLASNR